MTTVVAAALLLAALAFVVLYTSRSAFLSPLALVVVAAIGIAALLLQVRLKSSAESQTRPSVGKPWVLTALGVGFAFAALFGDVIHLRPAFMLSAALIAVTCFAVSGVILLATLRSRRL